MSLHSLLRGRNVLSSRAYPNQNPYITTNLLLLLGMGLNLVLKWDTDESKPERIHVPRGSANHDPQCLSGRSLSIPKTARSLWGTGAEVWIFNVIQNIFTDIIKINNFQFSMSYLPVQRIRGLFPRGWSSRSVKLTTNFRLVPKLWKRESSHYLSPPPETSSRSNA
jgi:hypothetical protein